MSFFKYIILIIFLFLTSTSYAALQVEIEIDGIEGELLKNVQTTLTLEQQKNHPRLSANRIKRLHQQATTEIQNALKPYGYYDVTVVENLTNELVNKNEVWRAHYHIQLGEPLHVNQLKLAIHGAGEDDDNLKKLIHKFPLKQGDILNQVIYEQGKTQLRNFALEYGYFDADFTEHEIQIDEQNKISQILLSFDTGKRYLFGNIVFIQELFNQGFLQRFLTFSPQEAYLSKKLLDFKNNLINSDYFEEVNIEANPTDDGIVPVKATLMPRKSNLYTGAIGYGTDTGVRGSLGWDKRYINQYGHRFSSKIQLSQIGGTASAEYYIPTGIEIDDYLSFQLGYEDKTTDSNKNKTLVASVNKHHQRQWLDYTLAETMSLEYRKEKFTIADEQGNSTLLMPGIGWIYLKADDRIYTKHGQKIQLNLRGAIKNVISDTSFLQTQLNGVFIRKLGAKGRVIARGELGYTLTGELLRSDFNELPSSIRFFAGGDRSVRGYDYQVLGPKNDKDRVIGGKHLMTASLEYEHQLIDKWSVATFYDVGNAFNNFSQNLEQGLGIGIRWLSPVGLIRVDVATALSRDGHPLRLHITIGPDL